MNIIITTYVKIKQQGIKYYKEKTENQFYGNQNQN